MAAGLRFALLGQHSLWSDEVFVLWITRFTWRNLLLVVRAADFHPPLYYLLMKAWIGVAGTGEAALRIPSASFSVLSVALTYLLMRKISSGPISLLSAFLVSVSPFHVMAGQEARMYPMLGALALASTLVLVESVERGGALRWCVYVALVTFVVYTEYLGMFVLIAHGLWILGWERRHLTRWLVATAVTTCLYAPWMPALWHQRGEISALVPTPGSVLYLRLADVLWPFAFGGSLFGTLDFSGSALAPLERFILLLPFVAILWWGAAAFGSDRRGLALIGLPLVMMIGATVILSLASPTFLSRWFSFLEPFYAMLLARGLVHVAEKVPRQRDRVLACCAAGLLLCSVLVLDRFYFDRSAWPFRWRAAAGLVARLARPDDFFLYVDTPAEETFTYYFRAPHPSLTLAPIDGLGIDALTAPQARHLALRYHRVWLVVNGPISPHVRQHFLPALNAAFRLSEFYDFSGAELYRFEGRREFRPVRAPDEPLLTRESGSP